VLHLRLRIGPIQRNGAAPGVIHIGRFFCPNSVEVVGKINGGVSIWIYKHLEKCSVIHT
jgi:hypothetical protein